MGKQWESKITDYRREASADNKMYNSAKFNELYTQLDQVCDAFPNQDKVSTLTRKIVEETTNIINYNKRWNWIKVRTEFNASTGNFKAEIIYDGGEYFDPIFHNVTNVVGSKDRFQEYMRPDSPEIDQDGKVTIRIHIKL